MKLGILRVINKENLSTAGDALPGWVDNLLEPLNQFIGSAGKALGGNLTFEDNFFCEVKTVKFTDNVELSVSPSDRFKKFKVSGVFYLDTNGAVVDKFGWSRKSDSRIGVKFKFDTASSSTCSILILYGGS